MVERALETAKRSLQRDFGISPDQIPLKQPSRPWAVESPNEILADKAVALSPETC
jgi:hypothetical protein